MSFRTKICGITNIEDALGAAEAGAGAIGLNFFSKSRRFVEKETARKIAAALNERVLRVGVFVNAAAHHITAIADEVGLDAVQLHGDERPRLIAELPTRLPIIRAHRCGLAGFEPLQRYLDECRSLGRLPDYILLDADAGANFGGSGAVADWPSIAGHREALAGLPLILAGGLTPDNVAAAIAAVHPDAVDVATGVESAPGHKDPVRVVRFISAANEGFQMRL
jgi:phosphoribosylanthranilate isomerase